MKKGHYTTNSKALTYDTTMPLLEAMYIEFKDLSKRKPDAAVSKSKINIANRLLTEVRIVLNDEEFIEFLDLLDEDNVGCNSPYLKSCKTEVFNFQ